ncbi:hypothetical protein WR25_25790 [Diploscapter pachys]|uniref:SXP/RAL-2 family protein Ani s 5-like cation-binding domain-containing protein n=1 Tax=Diploscapter pachys TaxID=2018661 RepID=A0A2A2JH47_9BILA|nr:hypothetical protein WR25_25790 [Diploscapter pachys]
MIRYLNSVVILTFIINFSHGKPATATFSDRRPLNFEQMESSLTKEQTMIMDLSFPILFDQRLSVDEKYQRLLAIPGAKRDITDSQALMLKSFLKTSGESIKRIRDLEERSQQPIPKESKDAWLKTLLTSAANVFKNSIM